MFDIGEFQLTPIRRHRQLFDVTNFIDIMIVLLIFLVATSVFSKPGVPVNQPKSSSATILPPKIITLDLTEKGTVFYLQKEVSKSDVKVLVENSLKKEPNTVIALNADAKSSTQMLLDVLDWCKAGGAERFSFIAQKRPL